MRAYVRHTMTLYDDGYTLDRLRGLQSLVQQEGGGAVQRVMQQYTRLVRVRKDRRLDLEG